MQLPHYMGWLVGGAVAGLVAYATVRVYFSSTKQSLLKESRAEKEKMAQLWQGKLRAGREETEKCLEAKKRDAERKWQAALGGTTEAPAKDPSLSIRQMIEATVKACTTAGSKATLAVERFTEFTLTVDLPSEAKRPELAQMAACLLRHGGPYLQRVRFTRRGELFAELSPEVLGQVPDWKQLTLQTVELLLEMPMVELRPARVTELLEGRSSLSPEEQQFQAAEDEFHELFAAHFAICKEMIRQQDLALNFSTIHSAAELEERAKALEQAEPRLKAAQAFFDEPQKAYAAILEKAGFDELVVRVTTRGYVDSHRLQDAHLLFIFDKLMERQVATKKLLATMSQHFGQWTIAEEKGSIAFGNPHVQAAYESVRQEFQLATGVLDQALKSMASKKG